MFEYKSTTEFTMPEFPGVVFHLNRMSAGRRDRLSIEVAKRQQEMQRLLVDLEDAHEKSGAEKHVLSSLSNIQLLEAKLNDIDRGVRAEQIRWGLARVEGLTIDGAEATAESIINAGPEEMFNALVDAVRKECRLETAERKNLLSLITSSQAETGETSVSTAENVSGPDTTQPETVLSTSPTT